MSLARAFYDLNGLVVSVQAPDAGLAAVLDSLCGLFRAPAAAEPDWQIRIERVEAVDAPDRAWTLEWEGPLLNGPTVQVRTDGRRDVMAAPGVVTAVSDRQQRRTEITVSATGEALLRQGLEIWVLERILTAARRHVLHGATLVDPTSGRAIAMFAPSGTGKSTTALALARAGLQLGGDDALVLEPETMALWPLPRRAKVHRLSAAMLPWVAPMLDDWREEEATLALAGLAGLVTIAAPHPRPVGAVVILRRPNSDADAWRPIAASAALTAILTDNVFLGPGGVGADGRAVFAALGRLVASVPLLELSVGPSPATLSAAPLLAAIQAGRAD